MAAAVPAGLEGYKQRKVTKLSILEEPDGSGAGASSPGIRNPAVDELAGLQQPASRNPSASQGSGGAAPRRTQSGVSQAKSAGGLSRLGSQASRATSIGGTKAALRMEQEFLMHMEAEHVEAEPLPARELTMSDHLLGFVSSGVTGQLYREAALDDSQGSSGMKRIYYPSGAVFEGDMSEGLWHGLGKLLFDTGDIYVGGFRNDRVHGKGKFVDTKGNWYEGFFFDGVPHGYGQQILAGGEQYSGKFEHGAMHGKGSYTWPDGRRYTGNWRQGRIHGQGRFSYPNGDYYEGGWEDEEFHGKGVKCEGGKEYLVLHEHGVLLSYTKQDGLYTLIDAGAGREGWQARLPAAASAPACPISTG